MSNSQVINGFLPVNKPAGITSFDVIRELRRLLHISKLGHSGVLDKPATGVLVIGANNATRLFELFGHMEKEYLAEVWLGLSTTTDDLTGELATAGNAAGVTRAMLERVIKDYVGTIDQIPPAFSLTKIGGKELYRYALEGKEIAAKPKRVQVFGIELEDFTPDIDPAEAVGLETKLTPELALLPRLARLRILVHCQGGVYVRSLARDIGADLGVQGTLGTLVRTRVGPFKLEDALSLEQLAGRLSDGMDIASLFLPVASIAPEDAQLALDATQLGLVRNGRSIRRFKQHLPPSAAKRGDLVYGMDPGHGLAVLLTVGDVNQHGLVELKPSKVLT